METYQYQSCVEACYQCAAACDLCAASCLSEEDPGMMARCIELDTDCAAVCRLTAGMVARNSEMLEMVCKLCEETCEECARECSQHEAQHCKDCEEACRRCAEECRQLAGNMPGWRTQQQTSMGAAAH